VLAVQFTQELSNEAPVDVRYLPAPQLRHAVSTSRVWDNTHIPLNPVVTFEISDMKVILRKPVEDVNLFFSGNNKREAISPE
jgi:hypothetical protein